MSMRDAIERGVAKGQVAWRGGRIICGSTFTSVIADHIMAEPLICEDVLLLLTAKFHSIVQSDLRDLANSIDHAANHRPLSVMPDAIGEWYEMLEKLNVALFEHVHNEDVLEALRFINMTGCEWSDYAHPQEAEDGE